MAATNPTPISRVDVGPLIIEPVAAASVAFAASTVVRTTGYQFRVPLVDETPSAAWVAEAEEIPLSDMSLTELVVTPAKVAGLTVISRELAEDSSPAAAQVVGEALARDIARRVDEAYFGNLAAPAPPGLAALTGVQAITGAALDDLDAFASAISKAEQVGATLSAFVTNPATALTLATLKEGTGSNRPLLGADATVAGERRILGVPLLTSPAVAAGVIWGIDGTRAWLVLREDVTLAVDPSRYFELDSVGVRATLRVGFAFGHPSSVVKVTAA